MKLLLNAGLLHGDCITISGKTIAETLADVPDAPRADQDVIMPMDRALYPQGHLAILKGNLSPEGCVAKITGLKNPVITGPARVSRTAMLSSSATKARRAVPACVKCWRPLRRWSGRAWAKPWA
ncbi:hypothetical protein G6F46_014605 [Rhizopus delemar]|nr:hypothetical protein G6F46_014605 [Rhizopus delemar]